MDRNSTTKQLQPDPAKFPKGIKGTADTVHDMGLKLGIYSSAGTLTCAKYPASLDNEDLDAQTWADWGVDCKFNRCGKKVADSISIEGTLGNLRVTHNLSFV